MQYVGRGLYECDKCGEELHLTPMTQTGETKKAYLKRIKGKNVLDHKCEKKK